MVEGRVEISPIFCFFWKSISPGFVNFDSATESRRMSEKMKTTIKFVLSGIVCFYCFLCQNCAAAPDFGRNSIEDAQTISTALSNKSLPATWTDARGRSIVKLHIQYGLERDAVRYIQNATNEEIAKLNLGDIADIAIQFNCQEVLRTLLDRGMSPNVLNVAGDSVLILSAREGRIGMMRILFDAGADINFVSRDGIDVLKAALASGSSGTVNLLLEKGISISKYKLRSDQGELFFYAIDGGNLDVIAFLGSQGFDPNLPNHFGSRPLKYAISNYASFKVLITLHNFGANECLRHADGKTAVDEMSEMMKERPVETMKLYGGVFLKPCKV